MHYIPVMHGTCQRGSTLLACLNLHNTTIKQTAHWL